jgi:hypothetical protein
MLLAVSALRIAAHLNYVCGAAGSEVVSEVLERCGGFIQYEYCTGAQFSSVKG